MLEEKRNSTVLRQFWFVDVENTLQVFPVDALYHLCLFRIDDEIPICILGVAEEVIVIYLYHLHQMRNQTQHLPYHQEAHRHESSADC